MMLDWLIPREQMEALREVVYRNERFVVVAHKNPDGDAVGSSVAMMLYLRSLGKTADVVLPNNFPDFLAWLPSAADIVIYESDNERVRDLVKAADVIFCLDFNSIPRLGDLGIVVAESTAQKVLIDHHLYPDTGFSPLLSVPVACSTSELVFRVIYRISGIASLSQQMAQAIYTGMMTDTGSFAYASNRKDIYIIVAELIATGIDKDLIYRNVFYNYSTSRLRLMGYVLYRKLKFYPRFNAALITLTHDELMRFNISKGDTEGLVNMPLQKKGVRFSCFLREELPGKINVSLRSVGDFPCNTIAAEFFGGGGHKNASGGELHDTMAMAVDKFIKVLNTYKKELTAG